MDDDAHDELVSRSPGPDGRSAGIPVELPGDTGFEESEDDADALMAQAEVQGALPGAGVFTSDDEAESCPICLNAFRDQAVGTPESCAHYFCLDCIVEWAKNANSCPVDRTTFKCICIRAQFGGRILKKIPVADPGAQEDEEDPTFCEVCGRSDREDRLLLCDGCDSGYHMECLEPPLQEVPVDEWFCPECAAPGAAQAADASGVSEEEVSMLLADVVPTTSRLRPRTGRTRAIARTRQSERVRATVNRNRISTASRVQHVPRHLVSSLLEETIEAVARGLSTAVYQRPLTPRAPAKRKRPTGRRKKVPARRKTQSRASGKSRGKKRQHRGKKRGGKTPKRNIAPRSRIARTLGLRRPARGSCTPGLHRPLEPSLGLMRADIGAAPLSVFGDPYELDPFDSGDELPVSPPSPLSAKRRALSRSALRSHQPVARPVSLGSSRRPLPLGPAEPAAEHAPTPDLVGSILSGQSLLMLNSSDVLIHRDGSLSARSTAPVSLQRNPASPFRPEEVARPYSNLQPRAPLPGAPAGHLSGSRPQSLGVSGPGQPALPRNPLHTGPPGRPGSSAVLGSGLGSKPSGGSRKSTLALGLGIPKPSHSPGSTALGRTSIAQLPRIPKIRQDGGTHSQDVAPARGQGSQLPSACISRLTGKEGPGQPGQGARREGEPSNRGPQEPSSHPGSSRAPAPSSHCSLPPLGPSRGKGVGSTFESFRVNIPGNTAPTGRLASPGFCNTFRPVDSKVQRKENSSPLFSIKKTKQLKSEIYDPFEPTGSDSSPPSSSPESLGSGLLPSEITRTISVRSPKAPPLQAVRCVTSYTVEGIFEAEASRGPCPSTLQLRAQGAKEEGRPMGSLTSPAPEPWDEDTFFSSEERMVTRVTILEPDGPPSPDMPQETTHRVVELQSSSRSVSRSRSRSSSRSRRKAKKKRVVREHRRTRSRTHSGSRDRSEHSTSPAATDSPPRRRRAKARSRRSSSERSSSHERTRKKKAKGKDRRRDGRGQRRTRSRSGSPHSSSYEHRDSRRKKRRRSESRSRSGDYSPASSLERGRRHKRQRERSRERPDRRDSSARPRERRKQRSRSPSSEHRVREPQPQSSQEKRPLAPEKVAMTEATTAPPPLGEPPAGLPAPAGTTSPGAMDCRAVVQEPPALSVSAEVPADDLDYGDSVEAGHVFEDFCSDAIITQLDDMSSPPSPESTDSSPERDFLPKPAPAPATWPLGTSLPTASTQGEVSLTHREGTSQLPLPAQGAPEQRTLGQDPLGMVSVDKGADSVASGKAHEVPGPEQAWQAPLLRSRALVKRVTWNLQEPAGSAAADRASRAPLHRPQRSREGAWDTENVTPAAATLAPLPELPPPSHALPEPVFLGADPSQVYSPYVPPALAPPANLPPYVPASQPTVQLVLQGSLPLAGCGLAQSLAPVPTALATATEPGSQATNSEERMATPKPGLEKTKKEEYMKKLHMQERAVEEVKLAIKPFYQRREVSKDEYKDILRKAVQKICHSKSGEINPVKVANLVKAYVDKYRHMRKHKKAEASAEPPAQGTEA
ncbi:PHD and RING finger domain-containing protein 1-like isoform X2 [Ochotona princeps]|uniref:PHD and RING finger domain-containing protein 1 isoform X2 n=1 Tax=Ochotona princeps TaxID=9978 RepID=UPI00271516CA|nr:PHD and RING finger domain-containing protein 1 isoform X2 [Ochotona princeps]XP_058515575.1 PHD and RING finger domain-containing protein 1 isoform X2 [Ochotona princeps]XP_058518587.1 PHD and RING finger domain-containing protein 1-like isoform X2 [Ochotona princeps]XP_058518588.1 PHD and RING finger domain-containing protein 1-like isoform X2 [Ochotona princeps]